MEAKKKRKGKKEENKKDDDTVILIVEWREGKGKQQKLLTTEKILLYNNGWMNFLEWNCCMYEYFYIIAWTIPSIYIECLTYLIMIMVFEIIETKEI